jgi:hypothetical protein
VDVHAGVEATAEQRIQPAAAVAAELLCLGEELGIRSTAVEERQLVAGREGRLCYGAADELRPAEDQELQSEEIASRSRSTSSSVL